MVKPLAAQLSLRSRFTFHANTDVSPPTDNDNVSPAFFRRHSSLFTLNSFPLTFPNLSDLARWPLRLLPHLSRFKNQFFFILHDVHHAYLLLHRAMALLPPTLIPNIEPTPLPSTEVWNQPEGLRPDCSDSTSAFIDAVHLPPPDLAEEEALMDELLEPNLPEPHQHVAAPPPDTLPDPSKLSTTASTPPKRKQKAKATPKAPVKRRRHHEQSRSRSSSPLTTWTTDEKQKLRTLKSDEKSESRFSWRVISTKMGKTEADVRSMWNKLKDQLG